MTLLILLARAHFYANKVFSPPYLFVILTFSSIFSLGILTSTVSKPEEIKRHFSNYYREGSILEIKILKQLKENDFYQNYLGSISRVDGVRTEGHVLLRALKKDVLVPIGIDHILISAEIPKKIRKPTNPGAFNFKDYWNRKGIRDQITLDKDHFLKTRKAKGTLRSKALIIRDRIVEVLKKQDFSENQRMVIEALLLGDKRDLSKELKNDYKNAGAMHILAISGLHIGVLMMILNVFLVPITRWRHGAIFRGFVLVLFLWFFAFISGLSASVVRAVTMFSILSLGMISNRSSKLDHYLFIAAFISLLFNPLYVFDLGFQLSYMAVLSIIYVGPKIKKLWNPPDKILRYFWDIVAISTAAQLGVLPLTLYYFHHFSAVFMLSSILLIPALGVLLGGGYLLIVLVQFNYLPKIYVRFYGYLIECMNQVVSFIGEMEAFIVRDFYFDRTLLVLGYFTIYFVLKCISQRSFSRILTVVLCFSLISTNLLVQDKVFQLSSNFIVFHSYQNSLLAIRYGNRLKVYTDSTEKDSGVNKSLENYSRLFIRLRQENLNQIRHFYRFDAKRILLIDNALIDRDFGFDPDILILIKSPKLNLQRLLERVTPSLVVADGSNYPSSKALWKKTCDNLGITFHDTSVDGALILSKGN
ncbi:ComEC/Rec2 family competence protein [Lutimonas sp.]|uniref:ComEC/Rec2 family competence protein n=1 Tax=Lutimonas sp. TaxID=1872403 RepID=UPI003D9B1250